MTYKWGLLHTALWHSFTVRLRLTGMRQHIQQILRHLNYRGPEVSWLRIHVCNPCGLKPPSFKFASSLISAKWRFFFLLFLSLGDAERERKEVVLFNESLPFLFFTDASHRAPPHINAATLTITNAFMCPSQRSVGKEGLLLIIKRYLFGSCRVLNSSYTWHFFLS